MWEVLGLSAETPITDSGHDCRGKGILRFPLSGLCLSMRAALVLQEADAAS